MWEDERMVEVGRTRLAKTAIDCNGIPCNRPILYRLASDQGSASLRVQETRLAQENIGHRRKNLSACLSTATAVLTSERLRSNPISP
jgi:hypothetical protein